MVKNLTPPEQKQKILRSCASFSKYVLHSFVRMDVVGSTYVVCTYSVSSLFQPNICQAK